ncbi:MAG: galactose-1-phosphate uridylyltransferase, partial [Lachnospiraceae bacterium]|nr:galactose-1-phosphate uridylyltransferase [Lachnospiraceae bacterium]
YHPHDDLHHIKKENIGLIEVMGLAILPSRLKDEMATLREYILAGKDISSEASIEKHAAWAVDFMKKYGNINEQNVDGILRDEIGLVFARVLEDAGVFKQTPEGLAAFTRFTDSL